MMPLIKEVLPPRPAPTDLLADIARADYADKLAAERRVRLQLIRLSFASILIWKIFSFYGVW